MQLVSQEALADWQKLSADHRALLFKFKYIVLNCESMVAASLQMSWSLHNEIEDFYFATFDLPTNHFVIWVRIKGQLQHEIKDFYFVTFDLPTNYFVFWVRIKNRCDHSLMPRVI